MGKARVASEIIDGIKTSKSTVTKTSEELGAILRGDVNAAKSSTENAEEVLVRTEDIKNAKKAADFHRRVEEAKKKAEAAKRNSSDVPITPPASESASVKNKKTFIQDAPAAPPTNPAPSKEIPRENRAMMQRLINDARNYKSSMAAARTDEEIADVAKHFNIDYKKGMSHKDLRKQFMTDLRKKREGGPELIDYFNGYHGKSVLGLAAVGAVGVDLFGSKGQLSNSQLYSDPFA